MEEQDIGNPEPCKVSSFKHRPMPWALTLSRRGFSSSQWWPILSKVRLKVWTPNMGHQAFQGDFMDPWGYMSGIQ